LNIQKVEFIRSAVETSQYPTDGLPQIVLAGRSNVGKSSFINAILNRKKIAKVSSTPGKTRLVNFFLINDRFYFVDIPGYGYAKVSKDMKESFQYTIENYLENSKSLTRAIQLLDIRHLPTSDDLIMINYFRQKGIPILFIMTKADKLSSNQRAKSVKEIKAKLQWNEMDKLFLFSSVTKENQEEILTEIDRLLPSN